VAKKLLIKTTKNQTKTNNDQREQTLTTEDEQHGFRKNNEGGHRRSGRVSSSCSHVAPIVFLKENSPVDVMNEIKGTEERFEDNKWVKNR
jgi:hypothetical protein